MIRKAKTLTQQLLLLPIGEQEFISIYHFKPQTVRQMISILNKKGYHFEITERGCIDGCKVTRIQ